MKFLNSLKDLDKMLTLARKHGVTKVKFEGMEFELDIYAAPPKKTSKAPTEAEQFGEVGDKDKILAGWDKLSLEDRLFYSASGQPPPQEDN